MCQCATPLALKVGITTQHSSIQIGIEIVANERVCQASSFRVRHHETTLTVASRIEGCAMSESRTGFYRNTDPRAR